MAQPGVFQNARLIHRVADQPRSHVTIIVDGDPLRDVRDLRKLTTVYRGGTAYNPQEILARAPRSDAVHIH